MAELYSVAIYPARVKRPRDKAPAEQSVLLVTRWILARLRKRTFFDLSELNRAIRILLEELNTRPFKDGRPGSRKDLFLSREKDALQPLPVTRFELARWKKARVHIDYHVEVDHHCYSVPYQYIGEVLDVKLTPGLVEIFRKGRPVAAHRRGAARYSTRPEHMPSSHREYRRWSPPRVVSRARAIGPHAAALVDRLLSSKVHPEQGYRPCLGIVRLADTYGEARLEAACRRALDYAAVSYRSVKSILEKGLDRLERPEAAAGAPVEHTNIRGRQAFEKGGRPC